MINIPSTLYQGASIEIEYEPDEPISSLVLFALFGSSKISVTLTESSGVWSGTLMVPADAAIGEYQYQLWAGSKNLGAGIFSVAPGYTAATTKQSKTPNEERLDQVQKAIDRLMQTGVSAYGVSGSFTTRLTLSDLNKEKFRLQDLVNRERRAKGMPYLEGTRARHYTEYMQF